VQRLLNVEVKTVRTLIVKGKVKRQNQHVGRRPNWKKAYVTLKKGQNLDLTSSAV
jgi:large subunit ribosomal protein L23